MPQKRSRARLVLPAPGGLVLGIVDILYSRGSIAAPGAVVEAAASAPGERLQPLMLGALLIASLSVLLVLLFRRQRYLRQLAAAQLRRADALPVDDCRFDDVFRSAAVGMVRCGLDGRLLDVNQNLCRMLGCAREDLVGSEIASIIHPNDRAGVSSRTLEQCAGVQSPTIKRRYLRRDGEIVTALHSSSLVRDASGAPQYFVGVINDVSAIEKSERALRLSEERFQLAMRATRDDLWDWHLPSGKVYFSPGSERLLGYGEHEVDDAVDSYRSLLSPEDAKRFEAAVADVAARRTDTLAIELRWRHRDGHYVDVLSRAFPIFDDDGRLSRLVGTHADISERKAIEAGLRERIDLHQTLTRISEMLPGALFKFRLGADGVYTLPYTSPAFGELLELDNELERTEVTAAFHRVHPDDLEAALEAYKAVVPGGAPGRHEYRLIRPSGLIWIEARFNADRDEDGGTIW